VQSRRPGIVEWWLIEQKIKQQTLMVKQVLSELVKKKYLLESKGMDARVRYRINHRKEGEIRQFLARPLREFTANCKKEKS